MLLEGMCSRVEVLTQTCLRAFHDRLQESNPPLSEFCHSESPENTPRGEVNRRIDNLLTNDAELKTNCNTLSVIKECNRIPDDGLWTITFKFL